MMVALVAMLATTVFGTTVIEGPLSMNDVVINDVF
jgi:hypothetical protein